MVELASRLTVIGFGMFYSCLPGSSLGLVWPSYTFVWTGSLRFQESSETRAEDERFHQLTTTHMWYERSGIVFRYGSPRCASGISPSTASRCRLVLYCFGVFASWLSVEEGLPFAGDSCRESQFV